MYTIAMKFKLLLDSSTVSFHSIVSIRIVYNYSKLCENIHFEGMHHALHTLSMHAVIPIINSNKQ